MSISVLYCNKLFSSTNKKKKRKKKGKFDATRFETTLTQEILRNTLFFFIFVRDVCLTLYIMLIMKIFTAFWRNSLSTSYNPKTVRKCRTLTIILFHLRLQ